MRGQPGFFDIDDRLKRLSDLGDQLEAFQSAVDFELFRPELNAALSYTDRTEGGRPPFDPVLMFKILVIQATNNLSDERAEFLINDRLSSSQRRLTPLVGRHEEIGMVMRRWGRARQGDGQLVLIVGEPGLGKSRLIEEFHTRLGETPHTWGRMELLAASAEHAPAPNH